MVAIGGDEPGVRDFAPVFNLYYTLKEIEPQGPFTYWVQHIYMNGADVEGKEYEVVKNVPYGTEVDPMTIVPVLEYTPKDGVKHVYKVVSRDPAEVTSITKDNQVFTIYYQRNDPAPVQYTYTVEHVYYAPDGITVEGRVSLTEGPVNAGWPVEASSIQPINEHVVDGTKYTYTLKSRSADIVVNDNNQVITLTYQRSASTPVDPTPTYNYYSVTVNYLDKATGEKIAESFVQRGILEGTSYDVKDKNAIAITGYTYAETTGDPLSAQAIYSDKKINVYYTKDTTPVDPPVTPVDPPVTPVDPAPVDPPKTGDAMTFWVAAAAASALGLAALALANKKRREDA